MCGRLACGLEPDDICTSCCYKEQGQNDFVKPEWKTFHNQGKVFKPSFNICPTDVAPVLISGSHLNVTTRFVVPMIFGLIPSWSDETSQSTKYSTINCRIETVESSKLYGPLLRKRQRCVVMCMGYFEWQSKKGGKPYFFHVQQPGLVSMSDPSTWNIEFTTENGSKGLKVLKLAGLFDVQKDPLDENKKTFSFTIITQEANSELNCIHHRMPAVIDSEEQVNIWLNCQEYDSSEALQQLLLPQKLLYYPVSKIVNFIKNKDIDCIKKNEDVKATDKPKTSLQKWLENNQKRKNSDSTDNNSDKKIKKE